MAMRWMGRYRIEGVAELRREYRELARSNEPLIVVANHLTFIDSAILIWAFGSNAWYALNFSKFSWNLPAGDFFKKKIRYRLFAAMAKGIFVHRDGSKAHKDAVVTHCATLLRALPFAFVNNNYRFCDYRCCPGSTQFQNNTEKIGIL